MLRRKFIQTALSGLTALGLAAVTKPPEVEVLALNIENNLSDYSMTHGLTVCQNTSDDGVLSLKSKDVAGPMLTAGEFVETDTYGTFGFRQDPLTISEEQ